MGVKSSDWTLFIESDTGATCKMVEIECADLGSVSDNTGGSLQSLGARVTHTNGVVETRRHRNYEPSGGVVVLPEDSAEFLEELRRLDCVIAMQRRLCANDGAGCCSWREIEHFSDVQIGAVQKSGLTASGLNATDGVPMVSASIMYGTRTRITNKPAIYIDSGGSISSIAESAVALAYCDCHSCSTGILGACQSVYKLTSDGSIHASSDGGDTWIVLASCLSGSNPSAIFCTNGRLLASMGNGTTFYADDPEGAWTLATGLVGNIIRFSRSGTVVYGLADRGGNRYSVVSSIDSGRSWATVLDNIVGEVYDIASAGQYVVVSAKKGRVHVSDNRGITWETVSLSLPGATAPELVAISLDTRNGRSASDVVMVVADHNNNIYKGNLGGWTKIFNGRSHKATSAVGSVAYLDVFLNGNLVWWAREVGGKAVVMKNAGDCTCWERWENDVSTGMCDDDSIPPDTYVLGCIVDGVVQAVIRCESQEIPCDDSLEYVYGCTVGDTTYVLSCDDDCGTTFVSPVNDCSVCTCPECDASCESCSCPEACDGCLDCGVSDQAVDVACLQELIDLLNCAAGCEAITLEDFHYDVECGQVALVGPGCIDLETATVYEVGCGVSMVFAACPHSADTAMVIGTESLQG